MKKTLTSKKSFKTMTDTGQKGVLFVVSTPVGNMLDITLRALARLAKTSVIACESPNHTRKLLSRHKIVKKQLLSYNDHNKVRATQQILQFLKKGVDVSLVSNAGTPLVSDPGFLLLKACKLANIKVVIIPGPTAHIMAVQHALLGMQYTFLGFLSPKTGTCKNQLAKLPTGTYVVHVPPHKLRNTLTLMQELWKRHCKVCVAKELTKVHETIWSGLVSKVLNALPTKVKGEYTVVFQVLKKD